MQATGFSPENCHSRQHTMVLDTMREVLRLARDEVRREALSMLIGELAEWFPMHASAEMTDTSLVVSPGPCCRAR